MASSGIQSEQTDLERKVSLPYQIFLVGFSLHILLNFIGTTLVSASFLFCALLAFFSVLYYDWKDTLKVLCFLALIEGQGRVLFGYNPLFRILFDLLVTLAIFKSFIKQKKFFAFQFMPKFTSVMLLLHFLWFILELFNPDGANFFASFSTAKFYILPFLLLFAHLNNPLDVTSEDFQKFIRQFLLAFFALTLLCIFQKYMGSDFLNSLSPNYSSLFKKFEHFQGSVFRPWGTSFIAGGFSIFYYLLFGLIFIYGLDKDGSGRTRARFEYLFLMIFILLGFFVLFISQVRSALLKTILVILLGFSSGFLKTKFLIRRLILVFVSILIVFTSSFVFIRSLPFLDTAFDLDYSISRFSALGDSDEVAGARFGPDEVFKIITEGVEYPLGFGLGMTTNFLPDFQAARENRKLDINLNRFWSGDNVIVFFFLELGIGALFILLSYSSFPYYLFSLSIDAVKSRSRSDYFIIATAFVQALVIVLGNWGAASIIYNPESFFFMFWVGLGFNVFYHGQRPSVEENSNPGKI